MAKGSDVRRLKLHWANSIPDKRLALQLLKVRPFIYAACRLCETTSSVIELMEEPLAVLSVPRSTTKHQVLRLYDGVLWINARLSDFSNSVQLKCSHRFRVRDQCFWLIRLLDYEVNRAQHGDEFIITINLLSIIQEFHLGLTIFDKMPNVMSALKLSEKPDEQSRVAPCLTSGSPSVTPTDNVADSPSLLTIPGIFVVSKPDGSSAQDIQSGIPAPQGTMEHTETLTQFPAMNWSMCFDSQLNGSLPPDYQTGTRADPVSSTPETELQSSWHADGNQSTPRPSTLQESLVTGSNCVLNENANRVDDSYQVVQDQESDDQELVNNLSPNRGTVNSQSFVSSSPTAKVGTASSILQFLTTQARKLVHRFGLSSDDAIEIVDDKSDSSSTTSNASEVHCDHQTANSSRSQSAPGNSNTNMARNMVDRFDLSTGIPNEILDDKSCCPGPTSKTNDAQCDYTTASTSRNQLVRKNSNKNPTGKLVGRFCLTVNGAIEISDDKSECTTAASNASDADCHSPTASTSRKQFVHGNSNTNQEIQHPSLGVLFRSILYRVGRELNLDTLLQSRSICNVRSHRVRRSSGLVSLCAPLIDSIDLKDPLKWSSGLEEDTSTSQTTVVNLSFHPSTPSCSGVSVTKSAPGRLRDHRVRKKRRRVNEVVLLREILRGVAEVSRIGLSQENSEKLRALSF